MPKETKKKKEASPSKDEKNSKIKSQQEIEKEIADMIKSSIIKGREVPSELEEDVDIEDEDTDTDEIRTSQFRPSLTADDFESGSPVLERVAASGPRPIFVGSSASGREDVGEGEINYSNVNSSRDEEKYFRGPSDYSLVQDIDFDNSSDSGIKADFNRARDPRLASQDAESQVWRSDSFDSNKERKETKYKFKAPKG